MQLHLTVICRICATKEKFSLCLNAPVLAKVASNLLSNILIFKKCPKVIALSKLNISFCFFVSERKIHISPRTKELLDGFGNFNLKKRKHSVTLKVRILLSYFCISAVGKISNHLLFLWKTFIFFVAKTIIFFYAH